MLKVAYFRTYPWVLQIFLLLMLITVTFSFGSFLCLQFLPHLTPYRFDQLTGINEHSPSELVTVALTVQGLLSLFIFATPALLFAYLAHPAPAGYLGLRKPGKWIQLLLVVFVMLGATPILQMLEGWISKINFGPGVKAAQQANDSMMSAFLNVSSFTGFLGVFVVMAIVPAIGEELFFRGIFLRMAKMRSRSMLGPIIFTAIVFAWTHSNIYGLLSIFLAGILLAVIYNLTGSLWCSILAHMFFNGLQVILSYLSNNNQAVKTFTSGSSISYPLVFAGSIIFGVSFYLLWRNRTPLPTDWTDDFKEEQIIQVTDQNITE